MSTAEQGREGIFADGFVSVREAAAFLKISRAKAYLLLDNGDIPSAKFGKPRRIPRRALLEYAQRSMLTGAPAKREEST